MKNSKGMAVISWGMAVLFLGVALLMGAGTISKSAIFIFVLAGVWFVSGLLHWIRHIKKNGNNPNEEK